MKTKYSIAGTTVPRTMARNLRTACAARLLLILLLLTLPASLQAQFNFTTNDGTIMITGYTGPGGAVTIPDTINGLPVTIVWNNAFNTFLGNTSPTSVTIPNSVTSIGNDAFYNCTNLTSVTIGSGVTNIGGYAFAKCGKLTGVFYQGNAPSLGPNVFWETWSATHYCLAGTTGWATFPFTTLLWDPPTQLGYTISNGTITVVKYTGSGGAVTIPDTINGLPIIGIVRDDFWFNTNLTSVTIGNYVTGIVNSAFAYCTNLTNVTIGNSVTSIGASAFNRCFSLTSVTIPNSVINIGDFAFDVCSGLTSVTIGNSVTNIGFYAFEACVSLTSVTIPNSVTSIADGAFYYCTSLTGVYFLGNAPSLGGTGVFSYDNNATVYYLPGKTGWDTWASPPPAVLWNPQAQTGDGSFGVRTNRFGFTITGTPNIPFVVESCTNLTNPKWFPLRTNTLTGGSYYFSDPAWKNHARRFYHIRTP